MFPYCICNAGVELTPTADGSYIDNTALAVAIALIIGKPLGIVTSTLVSVKLGYCKLPEGVTYQMILGISVLCSIGFTMSIYIGSLAGLPTESYKIGILLSAFIASILGMGILHKAK